MVFDADLTACADLVRRADPDRFLAVMAAPVDARAALFPLYAMNVEVSRAPWVTQEPMIAEMRLQWWRDVLAEIAAGGPVRRHEVATPLARSLPRVLAGPLETCVAARQWDIYKDPFADRAAFDAYLDQTAGTLLWAATASLGAADEDCVRDLGWASGLAAWFRAIPELETRGRVPLVDGRADAVRDLARTGLTRLARARSRRASVSAQAAPALLAAWQAGPILRRAAAAPQRVAEGTLPLSEASKRARLLWQTVSGRW